MDMPENCALVVDDDPAVRRLTVRALSSEGFQCDQARDGVDAERYLSTTRYALVVTDLAMPNKNGHELAKNCLALDTPPCVIVLTAVVEPRLAKDLLQRGVAQVEFKPVEYRTFAAKAKALASRVKAQQVDTPVPSTQAAQGESAQEVEPRCLRTAELNARLTLVARLTPISRAAMDVFEMTRGGSHNAVEVGAAVERDPALATEVLSLANSTFYNPTGEDICEPHNAVVRIGQKRIGELALASGTLIRADQGDIAWLNRDVMWRRSISAGVAVELLAEQGQHVGLDTGLFMTALLHAHGRAILASIYPERYEQMRDNCATSLATLDDEERKCFPETQGRVLANLLKRWNLPEGIYEPLLYIDEPFSRLERLAEPMKTRALLVKTAIVVSRISGCDWDDWDEVELPRSEVLRYLRIHDVDDIVRQTVIDADKVARYRDDPCSLDESSRQTVPSTVLINYQNLTCESIDLLYRVLQAVGSVTRDIGTSRPTVVGALDITPLELAGEPRRYRTDDTLVLTDRQHAARFSSSASVLLLPCSFGRLRRSIKDHYRLSETAPPRLSFDSPAQLDLIV